MSVERFQLSEFRAVYVAAGPLAAAVLEEEFAPFGVDAVSISAFATPEAARDIADTNSNFAIVPFDLGFPPERQEAQREFFVKMTALLANEGVETLALLTPSSFAPANEYKKSDWTARLPNGRPVLYSKYSRRTMACWSSPLWRERLLKTACDSIEAGAGGVFLDAVCFGAAPILVENRLAGPAGCHCATCRESFASAAGENRIPANIENFRDENTIKFVEWRASVCASLLSSVMSAVKERDPSAAFAVSVPHLTTLPAAPMFGAPIEWIAENADAAFMEHCHAPVLKKAGLTYDSPALKVLNAVSGKALPAAAGSLFGPSPDAVPTPKYFSMTCATGFSCGVVPVARFGEYRDRPPRKSEDGKANPPEEEIGDFLLGPGRAGQRDALALMNNWIEKNPDIYEGAEPAARVGLVYSRQLFNTGNLSSFKLFFSIFQTLTELQVPAGVVVPEGVEESGLSGLRVVIFPFAAEPPEIAAKTAAACADGVQFIFTGAAPPWARKDSTSTIPLDIFDEERSGLTRFLHSKNGARLLARLYGGSPGIYGGFPVSRRAGLPPPLLGRIPSAFSMVGVPGRWKEIHEIVTGALKKFPEDVRIEAPPYIHVHEWKKPPDAYFHIVNIAPGFPGPDACALRFPTGVSARVLLPGSNKIVYVNGENSIYVKPDPYAVVNVKNRY